MMSAEHFAKMRVLHRERGHEGRLTGCRECHADALVPVAVTEPRTATAADRPCELYQYHAPPVVQTAGHHIHPVYLQDRVYGRIRDPQLKWLCPNCHTAVHEVIGWLLGESRKPNPMPGWKTLAEAQRTVDWYRSATNGGTHA